MTEWRECTIADIGTVVGGATPSTKKPENYNNGTIPWITPKDLSDFRGRYISHGERNITETGLSSCSAQLLPANTVLFSSRAPIGYVAIAQNEVCTNQGFKSVIPNEETDSLFLYYLLKYNKDYIEGMGSGTTFKEVSGSTMRKISVRIPVSKDEQRKIGQLLGSLDDKIEENERINKNLEEQAQAIYQEQFGKTEANRVLSDICGYSKERIAVSELTAQSYYSTENMQPNKAGALDATSLPTTPLTTRCKCGDVLISNIRPYFKKIVYCYSECGCSADVICFTPNKPELSAFLFNTLYADKFFDYMVAGSKGTKMPRGDKQQIMTYPVNIPSDSELEAFNGLAVPILKKINANNKENAQLVALRDGLLPRLMSGEIDITTASNI